MSVIDDGVGQVLEALARNGLEDNTIVIFTADHGFSLGHHGFWGHGQATWPSNAYRIAYNIPLLIWAPGSIEAGRTTPKFVSSADLYTTILAYLDLTGDTDINAVPSRDFSSILLGNTVEWLDQIFIEQEETRAIRTPRWSYFKRFKGSMTYGLEDELYNLHNDPDERNNLAGLSEHEKTEQTLSNDIDQFFNAYADPRYDLWNGGAVKSNTSRPWLWKDAWGEDWRPVT